MFLADPRPRRRSVARTRAERRLKAWRVLRHALMRLNTHRSAAPIVAAIVLACGPLRAQTTPTTAPTVPLFTWDDAALAGGFVVATLALRPVDSISRRIFRANTRSRTSSSKRRRLAFAPSPSRARSSSAERCTSRGVPRSSGTWRTSTYGTEAILVGVSSPTPSSIYSVVLVPS